MRSMKNAYFPKEDDRYAATLALTDLRA